MKLKIFALTVMVITLGWQAGAQNSSTPSVSVRTWTFKQGTKFEGDYYSAGTTTVVVRRNGTNYFFKIADLSTNDQAYVVAMQTAQQTASLDAEARQLEKQGQVELTVDLMENFPEKVKQAKSCWMDVEFVRLDGGNLLSLTKSQERQDEWLSRIAGMDFKTADWRDNFLGFGIKDKNDKSYTYCWASKRLPVGDAIGRLKRGDKVRLKGSIENMDIFGADKHDLWFFVTDLRMIKPSTNE